MIHDTVGTYYATHHTTFWQKRAIYCEVVIISQDVHIQSHDNMTRYPAYPISRVTVFLSYYVTAQPRNHMCCIVQWSARNNRGAKNHPISRYTLPKYCHIRSSCIVHITGRVTAKNMICLYIHFQLMTAHKLIEVSPYNTRIRCINSRYIITSQR